MIVVKGWDIGIILGLIQGSGQNGSVGLICIGVKLR